MLGILNQMGRLFIVGTLLITCISSPPPLIILTVHFEIFQIYSENTWESAEAVAACKSLLDEFERSLAKQKESKAAQQQANTKVVGRASLPLQKSVIKAETSQPGPSTAAQAG